MQKMMPKAVPIILILSVILIVSAFFAGRFLSEKKNRDDRRLRCAAQISYAADKAGNQDLADPDVMEAVISNVYAACVLCDQPDLSGQLHEIWNTLIFRSEEYTRRADILVERLTNIAGMLAAE